MEIFGNSMLELLGILLLIYIIFKFGWVESSSIETQVYDKGDRIGQIIIMPYPEVKFVEAKELSETSRGTGGFGSTGQ